MAFLKPILPFGIALIAYGTQAATSELGLDLLLRQLDTLDRIANTSKALPAEDGARYYFDFERLSADIDVIRQGIKAHQSPPRAQPRKPAELTGHYTRQHEE